MYNFKKYNNINYNYILIITIYYILYNYILII